MKICEILKSFVSIVQYCILFSEIRFIYSTNANKWLSYDLESWNLNPSWATFVIILLIYPYFDIYTFTFKYRVSLTGIIIIPVVQLNSSFKIFSTIENLLYWGHAPAYLFAKWFLICYCWTNKICPRWRNWISIWSDIYQIDYSSILLQ